MAKNTYKQDEVLEEPFDISICSELHPISKICQNGWFLSILLSGIGGASGYVAPMVIQRALDLAIPEKTRGFYFLLWECWSASIW